MADLFEARVSGPLMGAEPGMAHLTVAVALEMARNRGPGGRPQLAAWMRRISDLPAMGATVCRNAAIDMRTRSIRRGSGHGASEG